MSTSHAEAYRPEIDGLRAIAVLAVVLYHFGVPGLGGGFVGVDVFFVISGFLIGGILWNELNRTATVHLGQFFLRRIRRLAPAYFLVVAVSTAVAYFVLLPFEFREFGKTLIAATIWMSNIQFFREAGYFDIASESKVLLHTWSLAVEEQFYIFLPLVLLLLRRFSRRITITVLVVAWTASLAGCILLTPVSPTATFFLFPFRAWELLSGVLLAIWGHESGERWKRGPVLSWLGLALVLGALVLIRPGAHFPGWQALWPVLGSVLLLLNGRDDNLVNRMLSSRAPVFIGLISYSLYLWHWPVFTLSTYWRDGYGGPAESAGWMLLSVFLAVAAWALVERPSRRHLSDRTLLIGFVSLLVATLAAGAAAYLTQGAPGRFSESARTHVEASTSFYIDWSRCSEETGGPLQGLYVCRAGPDGTPEVLFWGDSHLRAQMAGINRAAQETGTPTLMVWHAGCPPLFGVSKQESAATAAQDARCLADTRRLRQALPALPHLRRVVLVGRWSYYATGAGVGVDAHNRITLAAAPGDGLQGGNPQALYEAAWALTVQELARHFDSIHVLRQVPEMPRYIARDFARRLVHGRIEPNEVDAVLHVDPGELQARSAGAELPIRQLAASGSIRLIDTWPMLCGQRCGVVRDGLSYYFDNNHLNNAGADAMRVLWRPALTGEKTP
jgi:peptidoglycan/LPS O-acetylase OafA/YrhL